PTPKLLEHKIVRGDPLNDAPKELASDGNLCIQRIRTDEKNLGNTGLRVSALGLGTKVTFGKQISDEMAEKIVTLAYNKGVNFFETSEAYGNGAHWFLDVSTATLIKESLSLRGSLDRLQLEYVDIIIVTRQPDTQIPIEDVVRTCTHLIELGWAFYWGTCKWTPAEIMGHQALLEHILSPKGRMHQTQVRQLCKLASRLHCTCAQLAIAWCLKTPTLSCVLLGAATVDQLQENLEAIQGIRTVVNVLLSAVAK
ncbi:oxidoreductase, aldo/keto reductase family protein, partial [Opisthorchis viverrini]